MNAFLFVDGSCGPKDDIGAWAGIAVMGNKRKLFFGVVGPTTISRCELMPIIEGLRWIKANWLPEHPDLEIIVYSDSDYTVKTLSGMYRGRKNTELWAAIDEVSHELKIKYIWRERNSLFYMSFCDALCGGLRDRLISVITEQFKDKRTPEEAIPYSELPEVEDNTLTGGK